MKHMIDPIDQWDFAFGSAAFIISAVLIVYFLLVASQS